MPPAGPYFDADEENGPDPVLAWGRGVFFSQREIWAVCGVLRSAAAVRNLLRHHCSAISPAFCTPSSLISDDTGSSAECAASPPRFTISTFGRVHPLTPSENPLA